MRASILWLAALALPAGSAPAQERAAAPAGVLDAGALRAVHQDLLGRPPYAAERAAWSGKSLDELAADLLARPEFWEHWLDEQLYFFLLVDNFRPQSDRVRELPAELYGGRIGVRGAIHRIALSSSFDQRNPGPDTFVTVVMEQMLGITVQKEQRELEIGKKLYDGQQGLFLGRTGSSQADVVRIAVEDRGFLAELLRREHRRIARAEPAAKDLAAWVRTLEADALAFPALVRGWVGGEAYRRRLTEKTVQPNRLYVRSMYVDLMDRLPDADEARRMETALDGLADPAPLRSVLARLLLDSGETATPERKDVPDPGAWVQGLFERLLGRSASAAELTAFTSALQDPACRTTTAVYALVSHPEYQTY